MKKTRLILTLICLFGVTTLHAWEFPIKPGSEGWKNAKGRRERIALLQIPENVLHKMPTQDLLDLCLNYPFTPEIVCFDRPLNGLYVHQKNFNGFTEIFKRKNTLTACLIKYQTYAPDKISGEWTKYQVGEFKFLCSFLELIAGYYIVSNPYEHIPEGLLKATLAHYDRWIEQSESFFMTTHCGFLTAHICEKTHSEVYINKFHNNRDYDYFLETAVPRSQELIKEIMDLAKQL